MEKIQIHIKIDDVVKDHQTVERILVEACEKFQLYENTKTSKVPQTLISIIEHEQSGFGLGARIVEKRIIVDFFPHKHGSPKFDDVCDFVMSKLFLAFPERARKATEVEFISLYS